MVLGGEKSDLLKQYIGGGKPDGEGVTVGSRPQVVVSSGSLVVGSATAGPAGVEVAIAGGWALSATPLGGENLGNERSGATN